MTKFMPVICIDTRTQHGRQNRPGVVTVADGPKPASPASDQHIMVVMHQPTPGQAFSQVSASLGIFMRACARSLRQYFACIDRAHIAKNYAFRELPKK
jgi:hypothetical protein